MAADVADVAGLDDEAARELVLKVGIHLIRRRGDLLWIEERHRGVRARADGDGAEAGVQLRTRIRREPVAQLECTFGRRLRGDEAGGGRKAECRGIADRVAHGRTVEDARATAQDRAARLRELIREAEARPDVVPIGGERPLARAVAPREGDHARRPRHGIDRERVERVHLVVHLAARQFRFPAHAVVQRQAAGHAPVVLRVERPVGRARPNEIGHLHAAGVHFAEQEGGERVAGVRRAEIARNERREREAAGGSAIADLVVGAAAELTAELERVPPPRPRHRLEDLAIEDRRLQPGDVRAAQRCVPRDRERRKRTGAMFDELAAEIREPQLVDQRRREHVRVRAGQALHADVG